jgi:hypothetical protein
VLSDRIEDEVAQRQLRQACAEVERRLRAGLACSPEELLLDFPAVAANLDAALELIYTEFVLRRQLGQQVAAAQWCTRFPQWQRDLEQLFQVDKVVVGSQVRLGSAGATTPGPEGVPSAPGTAPPGPLSLPQQLRDYEVLGEIGRGGMGVVYKARQPQLQRLVALKMILTGEHAGPAELARFRAEAEAAARLHHPNIVQIFEVGTHDGRPFLVLEYVDGTTLADLLRSGPLLAADAAALVETLARAAQHAHERGVVHRDLKPANVLLARTGSERGLPATPAQTPLTTHHLPPATQQPKITDFGLAKQLRVEGGEQLRTQTGVLLGTPSYMAPEQTEGISASVGPAADVYALGAILYELLTGRPPFRGATVLDTLEQVRGQDPVPPRRLQPKLSRDLETICLTCLRKEPSQRYASALALAEDLRRYQAGEPIQARPAGVGERLWKWARRRPAVALLTVALLGLSVAAFAAVTTLWLQADAALDETTAAWAAEATERQKAVAAQAAEANERKKAEDTLYEKQLLLVYHEWENHQFDLAKKNLLTCDASRREARWRYLYHALHAQLWQREETSIVALMFDATGRELIAIGKRGAVVLDAGSGQELFHRPGSLQQVGFNAEKNRLLLFGQLGLQDKKGPVLPVGVNVCDRHTGDKLGGCQPKGGVPWMSPRGDLVAWIAGIPQELIWLDPLDGRTLHNSGLVDKAGPGTFSGNGQRFALVTLLNVGNETVATWDTKTKKLLTTIFVKPGPGEDVNVARGFYLNVPGDRVALVYTTRKSGQSIRWLVKVFDVDSGEAKITLWPHGNKTLGGLAFCPSGQRLATASADGTIILWDLRTGKELLTLRGEAQGTHRLAFSPDGCRLAATDAKTLTMWDCSPLE